MVTIWILIIYFIVLDIYNAKRCQNYWSTSDFWSQNSMIWPSFWFNCNWYWVFDMKWIQIHVNYVKGAVIIEIFIYNSYYSVKSKLFIGFFWECGLFFKRFWWILALFSLNIDRTPLKWSQFKQRSPKMCIRSLKSVWFQT